VNRRTQTWVPGTPQHEFSALGESNQELLDPTHADPRFDRRARAGSGMHCSIPARIPLVDGVYSPYNLCGS